MDFPRTNIGSGGGPVLNGPSKCHGRALYSLIMPRPITMDLKLTKWCLFNFQC